VQEFCGAAVSGGGRGVRHRTLIVGSTADCQDLMSAAR
jgi:hypothetical protein